MLALKAFAQEIYVTLAHISLTKANRKATRKFNKVEMYNCPQKRYHKEMEYLVSSNTINHAITNSKTK